MFLPMNTLKDHAQYLLVFFLTQKWLIRMILKVRPFDVLVQDHDSSTLIRFSSKKVVKLINCSSKRLVLCLEIRYCNHECYFTCMQISFKRCSAKFPVTLYYSNKCEGFFASIYRSSKLAWARTPFFQSSTQMPWSCITFVPVYRR